MAHSTVDAERLCLLAKFYQWAFVYDDFFDSGEWSKRSEDARHAADLTKNVLRDPATFEKTSFAPIEMLRSIMLQINKTANQECQRRLVEHTEDYIDAAVEQVISRTVNNDLNINTYHELRRKTGAMATVYDFITYSLDLDIPNDIMANSTIQKLLLYCKDICGWANDIYSFNIEQSWGETHNLVIIGMTEGRSLQSSIDYVEGLVKERFDAYVVEKEKIPSWGSKVDQDVATFLTAVEQWVIGLLHWHFATERYFGTLNDEVMKTKVVTVLPRKVK